VRDGDAKAFREEGKARHRRRQIEAAQLAFAGADMRGLAGRPGDGAIRTDRDLIDPALPVIGGQNLERSVPVGGDQQAVVAAGDDTPAVGGAGENRTPVNGHLLLAFGRGEQQRFLAEHEHRRLPEKMYADDGTVGLNQTSAVSERGKRGGGVGHRLTHFQIVMPAQAASSNRCAIDRTGFPPSRGRH
jgi:hypothetical protein